MTSLADLSPELQYVGLLFLIFIVPRLLQRLGLPAVAFGSNINSSIPRNTRPLS